MMAKRLLLGLGYLGLTSGAACGCIGLRGGEVEMPGRTVQANLAGEAARVVRVVDATTYIVAGGGMTYRVRVLGAVAPAPGTAAGRAVADSVRALLPAGRVLLLAKAGHDLTGCTRAVVLLPTSTVDGPGPRYALDSLLVARGWAVPAVGPRQGPTQQQPAKVRASMLYRLVPPPPAGVIPQTPGKPVGASYDVRYRARVRRVVDADTYEVEADGGLARVRLLGVDAPEAAQPFGRQATAAVSALVLGQYVLLQVTGQDQYGRYLAAAWLRPAPGTGARAVSLDSLLVARGWAWAYAPSGQPVRWAAEQQAAQLGLRGLWRCGTAGVVRPGIWRAYNREDKATAAWGCPW